MKAIHSSMKYSIYPRRLTKPIVGFLVFIFFTCNSVFAQPTFVGASSNPADGGSVTTTTVTVAPPAGTLPGDLVVVYAHHRSSSTTRNLTISGGGQTWTSETKYNNGNEITRIFWCEISGTLTSPTVTQSGTAGAPLTAVMYVYHPSSTANTWIKHAGPNNANASTPAISITGITTTVYNTVTMGFWGSEDDVTWGAVSGAGWNKPATTQYRNMGGGTNGDEQTHTGAYNLNASTATIPSASQTQSPATPAVTSLISWAELAPTPGNDLCSGATSLIPGLTCGNIPGNFYGSDATGTPTITGSCAGSVTYDEWYSFVAVTNSATVTMSSVGSSITNSGLELLSGTCGGTMTSLSCGATSAGTASVSSSSLTIGNTYYVRAYSTGTAPTSATNAGFNICATYTVPNDNCAGAVSLTSNTSCSNTAGTLVSATATTGLPAGCEGAGTHYDTWFSFVAANAIETVTISSQGTNFTNPEIQLYSGTCGALVSQACGTTTLTKTGLTVGSTYYVRVSNVNTAITSNGGFNICVTHILPPANDNCAGAVSLTSGTTCSNTAGTLVSATATTGLPVGCEGVGTHYDVWYSFVAANAVETVTISSQGTNFTNPEIQLYSGTCGALVSQTCGTTTLTNTGLTVGATYYVRVSNIGSIIPSNGGFNICVTHPAVPANNAFGSPTTLTPATTCINTAGTLYLGTYSAASPTVSGTCVSGTISSDVWYSFVAPADVATIALSGVGSDVTGVEVMTTISGTTYSIACGGPTGIPVVNVVAGNTYFVRVYKTGAAPSFNSAFNICVTVQAVPNDECSGAINLSVSANCSKAMGTVSMATLSTGFGTVGTCGSAASATYDVWYKFTATTTTPTITIQDFGAAFPNTKGIEIYQGACGSLASMSQCANGTGSSLGLNTTGLTVGTTYYVRVYSTGASIIGNGKFSICVTSGATSNVRTGNSYVNVTKNTTGGVVEVGDILEIRMTVWVGYGTTLYNARYVDNLPTKTTMQTGNEIQIITNEGLRYRGYTATDGLNDDAATYKSSPGAGEFNIRANLGTTGTLPLAPANNTATDLTGDSTLVSTSSAVPRAGSGLMFAVAYRVQVTGAVGDTVQLYGGRFRYRTAAGSTSDSITSGTSYKILISQPLTLCSNSAGVNNASEFGGTFGSGSTLNRSTDLTNPIAGYTFVAATSAQAVGDGQYALVNNTSPRGGINQSANKKNVCPTGVAPDLLCDNRMFTGYWYINGDHSGTNNANGNNPVAPGTTGGYMLAVNADYVASEAYRQQLTGLCPNTYYEFSAWFKNICPSCGADSIGAQFTGTPTAPTAGYVGVYPNLSFALDGLDRYSTGQVNAIAEVGGWTKKGFVFRTDTAQTTATLSIRNNAQGGGGNDWVMDDISIATCFPSMSYSPTATPSVCSGNTITIGDTVRSQFNNYTFYVWQRSTDNGATWTNITSTQTATPTLSGGQYQYITSFAIPPSSTNPSDSGDIYRVYTATTNSNITTPNCIANDGSAPISLSVLTCGIALKTDLLSFNGNLMNKYGVLSWSTSLEDQPIHFELQRSDDNISFTTIKTVNGKNNGQVTNYYSYTDPDLINSKKWYRVILINEKGNKKYSHIIQLSTNPVDFELENVINPFSDQLLFNIILNKGSKVNVELIDMQGKIAKSNSYIVYTGVNSLRISNTDVLASGIYTLRIENNGSIISKKVMKK